MAHRMGYCSKKFLFGLVLPAVVFYHAMLYMYIYGSSTMVTETTLSHIDNISRSLALSLKWDAMSSENFGDVTYSGKGPGITHRPCNKSFKDTHFMSISYSGRTGNLLFQFATLLAVAESTCYTAIRRPGTIQGIDHIFHLDNVRRVVYNRDSFKELEEPGFAIYDENITLRVLPGYNWTITGYRQSYRYFENYLNLIRSSFRFKETIKGCVADYLKTSLPHDRVKVGLHVRRSDILNEQARTKLKYVSDVSYIYRAIAFMRHRLGDTGNALFIVISDAIAWCKGNVKGADVFYSPFLLPGEDLYLLTQCEHHILTFGTFSWMGAWLNESGIVVYIFARTTNRATIIRAVGLVCDTHTVKRNGQCIGYVCVCGGGGGGG